MKVYLLQAEADSNGDDEAVSTQNCGVFATLELAQRRAEQVDKIREGEHYLWHQVSDTLWDNYLDWSVEEFEVEGLISLKNGETLEAVHALRYGPGVHEDRIVGMSVSSPIPDKADSVSGLLRDSVFAAILDEAAQCAGAMCLGCHYKQPINHETGMHHRGTGYFQPGRACSAMPIIRRIAELTAIKSQGDKA